MQGSLTLPCCSHGAGTRSIQELGWRLKPTLQAAGTWEARRAVATPAGGPAAGGVGIAVPGADGEEETPEDVGAIDPLAGLMRMQVGGCVPVGLWGLMCKPACPKAKMCVCVRSAHAFESCILGVFVCACVCL